MKSDLKYQIPVGIFFIIAISILVYYTVIMSHEIIRPDQTYEMTVFFENTLGLEVSSKVKVNGVVSGTVEKVELKDNLVWVKLRMFNAFTLYRNYKIKVNSDSIMGGRQVSISTGSRADKLGNTYAVIETREGLNGTFEDPVGSLSELIDENKENVQATLKNIREITDKINAGKGTLGKLINEDSIHAKTGSLLRDMNEAIEDAREQAPITSFLRAALTFF